MTLALLIQVVAIPALATKILTIAAVVYAVIQGIKQVFPNLSGWYALALNIGLSTVGIVVATPADQLLTLPTLLSLIAAAAGAAGVHGTVASLTKPPEVVAVEKKLEAKKEAADAKKDAAK